MLDEFIAANRELIIARARARVASRTSSEAGPVDLENGIPVFLDQLCEALRLAKSSTVIDHGQLSETAIRHGHDLLQTGLTIGQVVHEYGDVCQTVTEMCVEQATPIPTIEFQTLNLCLDDAIAGAVTEYARHRELGIAEQGTERLGVLAHELRNLLNTAVLSFDSIQSGRVAPGGSTGLVHARSLMGIRNLIDRSLAEVRLDAGIGALERIPVAELLEEVEVSALLQAQGRDIRFTVETVAEAVWIEGDRQILAAALSNLLQNALKFTGRRGRVSLTTHTTADRVLFDVEDECGGLPSEQPASLFRPFQQRSSDRRGVGLGLAIALKIAKAHGGEIHVRDLPGKGCIFTLDLPRATPASGLT